MAIETTYTNLREQLASLLDKFVDDQEVVIVRRRKSKDVAIIPASELASLIETRLLSAFRRTNKGQGKPQSIDQLRGETGLDPLR